MAQLTALPTRVQALDGQLKGALAGAKTLEASNQGLANGLVSVSSGSALVANLFELAPSGVELKEASVLGPVFSLKGGGNDPGAFQRINALQLQLKRSPLLDPNAITLVKASREAAVASTPQAQSVVAPVNFEIQVNFRPAITPLAEKQILTQLGSDGLVRRLDLLQKEGLL